MSLLNEIKKKLKSAEEVKAWVIKWNKFPKLESLDLEMVEEYIEQLKKEIEDIYKMRYKYLTVVDKKGEVVISITGELHLEDKVVVNGGYSLIMSNEEPIFSAGKDDVKYYPEENRSKE